MMSFNSKIPARYRMLDGKASIELKLREPRQLFDERDPAPFRDRDLDDDAARYILNSFKDLKHQRDVKVSIYFESLGDLEDRPQVIAAAIRTYFRYEADLKRRALRDLFREGLFALLIGLSFLATVSYFVHGTAAKPDDLLISMLHEGVYIMGLVAMWKPISIFLYDWWPILGAQRTYARLSEVEVEVLPMTLSASRPRQEAAAQAAVHKIPQPTTA